MNTKATKEIFIKIIAVAALASSVCAFVVQPSSSLLPLSVEVGDMFPTQVKDPANYNSTLLLSGNANSTTSSKESTETKELKDTQTIKADGNASAFSEKWQKVRIGVVSPTFTWAAYKEGGFYDFYGKYLTSSPIGTNITSDINMLTSTIPHGPFQYFDNNASLGIPGGNFIPLTIEHIKKTIPNAEVTSLEDVDIHDGRVMQNDSAADNAYDILVLFHDEYMTSQGYNNLKQFVGKGGTILFMESNSLIVEVSYNQSSDSVTLARGHLFSFDGKVAQRTAEDERWVEENSMWRGTNFMTAPTFVNIPLSYMPFNYTHSEEQFVSNNNSLVLFDYGAKYPRDGRWGGTIATSEMAYGKGKVIEMGIFSHKLINDNAFWSYVDNIILPRTALQPPAPPSTSSPYYYFLGNANRTISQVYKDPDQQAITVTLNPGESKAEGADLLKLVLPKTLLEFPAQELLVNVDGKQAQFAGFSDDIETGLSILVPGNAKQIQIMPSGISGQAANLTLQHYDCMVLDQASTTHCDVMPNKIEGFAVSSRHTDISEISAPLADSFVETKTAGRGNALEFKASHLQTVKMNDSAQIDAQRFSVAFWVKANGEPFSYAHIISHVNARLTSGWFFDTNSNDDSHHLLAFNVAGARQLVSTPSVEYSEGQFTHIVGVFDGNAVKIFKNGLLAGESKFVGTYNANPNTPLRIGGASSSAVQFLWSGIMQDVLFYNRPLSDSEVKAIYHDGSGARSADGEDNGNSHDAGANQTAEGQAGSAANATTITSDGLVGHWPLDHDLSDVSGNSNNGILTAMVASMAFAPDGRLFFTEKDTGRIMIMKNDTVIEAPFATIADYYSSWEQGLLGITLDSKFSQNHFVYLYYTCRDPDNGGIFNKVVRFTDKNGTGENEEVILDQIPASDGYHAGGAMAFGPLDDKLYIAIGDGTEHAFAQDPNIALGKVLRINRDGTIPPDNPHPDSPVFTSGHRNMYGIAFDHDSGFGIIAENGDNLYDRISPVVKGGNYGFPTLQLPNVNPFLQNGSGLVLPMQIYRDTIAPTQAIYYDGDKFPELKGKFLFGSYTGKIHALTVDENSRKVTEEQIISLNPRAVNDAVIGIAQSPDGDIYYGGYSISKLSAIVKSRSQVLFPADIRLANSSTISEVQLLPDQAGLAIYLQKANGNNSVSNESSTASIVFPFTMLSNIAGVYDMHGEKLHFQKYKEGSNERIVIQYNNTSNPNALFVTTVQNYSLPNVSILASDISLPVGGMASSDAATQTASLNGDQTPIIKLLTDNVKPGKSVIKVRVMEEDSTEKKRITLKYAHDGKIQVVDLAKQQNGIYSALIDTQAPSAILEFQMIEPDGKITNDIENILVADSDNALLDILEGLWDKIISFFKDLFSWI